MQTTKLLSHSNAIKKQHQSNIANNHDLGKGRAAVQHNSFGNIDKDIAALLCCTADFCAILYLQGNYIYIAEQYMPIKF